ncbi:SpvB/TcaC N-terminal domain-containing protein [Burkholderia sp. GbtcB21]|uniref:SpvB/TcaC N-terminal domain-containing protein n=1 Tax=Burkholderia sp. GbtcB21 TaxID=2824766 RepID=UPI001C306BB5|nr:SpvB/TcaC N-terminal domain-containing protein [Burkholderia sp. GbtcB21]
MPISEEIQVASLTLPKGGGAITGMGEALHRGVPDGMAHLSLPVPVSGGRGGAPELALTYSSGTGNGPFGLGSNMGVMAVSRRTGHGVPGYEGGAQDEFVGPGGLVSERDGQAAVVCGGPRI